MKPISGTSKLYLPTPSQQKVPQRFFLHFSRVIYIYSKENSSANSFGLPSLTKSLVNSLVNTCTLQTRTHYTLLSGQEILTYCTLEWNSFARRNSFEDPLCWITLSRIRCAKTNPLAMVADQWLSKFHQVEAIVGFILVYLRASRSL
jgi:hypothetical protein